MQFALFAKKKLDFWSFWSISRPKWRQKQSFVASAAFSLCVVMTNVTLRIVVHSLTVVVYFFCKKHKKMVIFGVHDVRTTTETLFRCIPSYLTMPNDRKQRTTQCGA
jgi:hypothetical protein